MIARKAIFSVLALISLGLVVTRADPPTPEPAGTATPAAPVDPNAPGPKIEFATPIYDFGKIKSGDPVKYTYYFTNSGDQALEISAVRPSCGCTTAGDFTKKVEPGQSGSIPIQFNSGNFNGQVFKTITVSSTAKNQPTTVLQLKGTIWKAIEFLPAYAVINITPDAQSGSTVVRITNNMPEPLDLYDAKSTNPNFSVDLKTNELGKGFELTIVGKRPLGNGTVNGQVTLKSSATNNPTVTVPFWANVQSAVMVFPGTLNLPPGPLTTKSTPSITIQNNSSNQLSVTEAAVSIPGVELQFKEMQPGKVFSAQLVFPEGFLVPTGKEAVFTAKTSNPQTPVIRVPIFQTIRPSPPQLPTPSKPTAAVPTPPASN